MIDLNRTLKLLLRINIKTIIFNFKYFPLSIAVKMPVLVSNNVNLKKVKGNIHLSGDVFFGQILIGYGNVGVFDKRHSKSIWEVLGSVEFKGTANIGHGSKISVGVNGKLIIGDKFNISAESTIIAFNHVEFGDNCLVSWDVLVMDTDFHKIINKQGIVLNKPKKIIVGNNVWIGCRCLLLKGGEIPNDSIIGAASLITKKLEKSGLYAGHPAKYIQNDVSWKM